MSADDVMPPWAVRLEGKIDLAIAQHGQRLDNHQTDLTDHEARMRALERDQSGIRENAQALVAQNLRLTAIESASYVTTRGMWAAVGAMLAGVTALGGVYFAFVDLIPRLAQ